MFRIFVLMFFTLCHSVKAQNLISIFNSIDTISLEAAAYPGSINLTGSNVTPIISTKCGYNIEHFGVTSEYGNGKTMGLGHEGILTNGTINMQDNSLFITQAFHWLSNGITSSDILLKNGWTNSGNTSLLKTQLETLGYTFSSTSLSLTPSLLNAVDVLILGNDWNGNLPYSAAEINAITDFIDDGGSVLILGLGWSWPNNITDYPMNMVASNFGYQFSTDGIDENQFINFHPIDTSFDNCYSPYVNSNLKRGDTLRVLKMAVSSTGEFTQENGGISNTSTLIDNWIEELNQMYGREYAVRFELISNNDDLIFDNSNSDPWTNIPLGSSGCDNAELIKQQQVIDSIIGYTNYDISHVIISPLHLGGGCASSLTFGISGGLDIPVSRHEIGHQFGQSHTINYDDNINYETENGGWTVQGGNNHGRAHGHSYQQLVTTLNNQPNLGTKFPTGNTIPLINGGLDYYIPKATPFVLTATGSDPDISDSLTYVWDNMDRSIPQFFPVSDDRQGALFMRLLPSENNTRTFPKMEDVLLGLTQNSQEQLPSQARKMNIRVTVNDNHKMLLNGNLVPVSGVNSDDIRLSITNVGPFEMLSQSNIGISYTSFETPLIEWNVNQTNLAPIFATHVKISLSIDGGQTFPYVLADSTLNDGSEQIQIPEVNTSEARIKIEALNNIFFCVNAKDFMITHNIGITENFDVLFNIYPNPVDEYIMISSPNISEDYLFTLRTIEGKIIFQDKNTKSYRTNHINNGIFLVEIRGLESNQKTIQKIEIIH